MAQGIGVERIFIPLGNKVEGRSFGSCVTRVQTALCQPVARSVSGQVTAPCGGDRSRPLHSGYT